MRVFHLLTFVGCVALFVHAEYVSEEETCECVPLNRCATEVNIVDISKKPGGCSHYLDTCCTNIKPLPQNVGPRNGVPPRNGVAVPPRNGVPVPPRSGVAVPPKNSVTVPPRNRVIDPPRNSMSISPGEWRVSNRPMPPPPSRIRHGCGQRNPNGASSFRIVNNTDGQTQFAEWPWMVAVVTLEEDIETNDMTNLEYHCGGSLIHPKAVLTAAHCVNSYKRDPNELKVLLGEWDTQTENEDLPVQEIWVTKVIVHERFEMGTMINDVAVLILDKEAKTADNVDTICLPKPASRPPPGTKCIATGWGKDRFGVGGLYQVILKSIKLPIVTNSACQEALRKTRLSKFFRLHESFVCAGGEPGIDTCKGDGGGPLFCPVPGREGHYEQVGIVSWGIGCGENGIPGVYADVSHFRAWIDDKLIENRLDKKPYTWPDENVVDENEDEELGPDYDAISAELRTS